MRLNKTFYLVLFLLILLVIIIITIRFPSRTKIIALDFYISDQNNNYQYEANEKLEFRVSDTTVLKEKRVIWQFGNGDSIVQANKVNYTYTKAGKYLVTLKIENLNEIHKYIDVVGVKENKAVDSIPIIQGPDEGYVGEQLFFFTNTIGVKSWYWEFGESGTVDAYEEKVTYTYKNEGVYFIKLNTNQSSFPVYHKIKILPLFNPITSDPLDSLRIVANDIRRRLQAIADAKVMNSKTYYENMRYIERNYMCSGDEMVIVINGDKYNDLYSYCQGLHYLGGKGSKSINISQVVVDTIKCITKVEVTQNIIEK